MIEKKNEQPIAKKVYKSPSQVKSVDSGKIVLDCCPSLCGSRVSGDNATCGHY